jgi:hypothetical protein
MTESNDIKQLLDKFKKEIIDDVNSSNAILIKKMEDLETKVLNFLSIISGVVGANNASGTTKTPKPSNRKVRVNENVIDISQFNISYDKKDEKESAAISKVDIKVQKTKYISNCINYILTKKITFKDLNVHCNIDIDEVKTFPDIVKSCTEASERFEKLKELTRKFLEAKDEIQKQRIKTYVDSLDFKDVDSSLSYQ